MPRWDCNDVLTQRAYDSLVQRMETEVILLTHSQADNFGLTAAVNHPERVRAVVSLDPSGAPSLHDAGKLRGVPHLSSGVTFSISTRSGFALAPHWNVGDIA